MNGLSDRQITRLAEAFERGYSRAQAARYAGVCESTVVKWREYAVLGGIEIPKLCGCGRIRKHLGQCKWRRECGAILALDKETS